MDSDFGDSVLARIGTLRDLEHLDLSGGAVSNRGLNQLRGLTNLQTLSVRAWSPTGPEIDETPLALSSLKRLKTLSLLELSLQDGDLASLVGLSDLERLCLQGTFTEAGLAYLQDLAKVKFMDRRGFASIAAAAWRLVVRGRDRPGDRFRDGLLAQRALAGAGVPVHPRAATVRCSLYPNENELSTPPTRFPAR